MKGSITMLSASDYKQIYQLMEKNPDFGDAINKIEQHQQMLLSSIAHDAKNSLTLLNSSLQLFQKKHSSACEDSRFIEIQHDVKHLLALMQELSDSEFDHFLLVSDVDLLALFQEIAADMHRRSYNNDFHIKFVCPESVPTIHGDKTKLTHAFTNLIRNSYDAMNGCGTLTITIEPQSDSIKISIADTGCGIPHELASSIFNSHITSKENGSGLGLPISKNIFESHGGTINFISEPHIGTTFIVILPLTYLES